LISNVSVLVVGLVLIARSCIRTSEGDFLDVGFDDRYDYVSGEEKKEDEKNEKKEEGIEMLNPVLFIKNKG